jgi:LysR family glycine cleavage system transcriptional activator
MDKRLKHLNALRSFESAARHQSYSQAANELFVSQAAISQQMRQLEQALAVKLFVRSGRSMKLTQSGEKLYQTTHQALNMLVQGFNDIQCESIAGDLTLTSTQAFCSLWLMPRLYRFSQLHPDINIKILGSNQLEDLQAKHIDLAIRFSTQEKKSADASLVYEDFGEDYVYPVCAPALVDKLQLHTPESLLKCPLIIFANEKIVTWREWFSHVGVVDFDLHTQKTEVTSSDMALSAVLNGHGVTLAATTLFSQYFQTKQLVVPFKIKHPVTWKRYLVFDENSAKINRINVFTQWLKVEMASFPLRVDI